MKWEWPAPVASRVKSAKSVKLDTISYENGEPYTIAHGSKGERYNVSLHACDCAFFSRKRGSEPCKHMVRLAMDLNLLNNNSTIVEETIQKLKDKIALAAGYYYVFNDPIMSDSLYDLLKSDLKYLQDNK